MKKTEAKLTEEQKKAILSRIDKNEPPKKISETLGLDYDKVRYFVWNQKNHAQEEDVFNRCAITGFKSW